MSASPDILALAADLGLRPPAFRAAQAPELFQAWADRVLLADTLRRGGKPYEAELDECDRCLGRPATRVIARPRLAPVSLPTLGEMMQAVA